MSKGSNGLMDDVMQYTASGTIAAAALGYQMLSSIVGEFGVPNTPLSAPVSIENEVSANVATIKSPTIFSKQRWGRRRSSYSKYSTAGVDSESSLPLFTLQDVANHDMQDDCWVVLYDRVYDITNFLDSHPGGDEVMLEYAGHDATLAFRSVGHSREAEESLKPYLIGILVENERIWTRFFNMKSDMP